MYKLALIESGNRKLYKRIEIQISHKRLYVPIHFTNKEIISLQPFFKFKFIDILKNIMEGQILGILSIMVVIDSKFSITVQL